MKICFDDVTKAKIVEAYASGMSFGACARKFGTTAYYIESIVYQLAPHLVRNPTYIREKKPRTKLIDDALKDGVSINEICRKYKVTRPYVMTRRADLSISGEYLSPKKQENKPAVSAVKEEPFITPPTRAQLKAGR